MNHIIYPLVILFVACFCSCGTPREMAYVSDAERDSAQQILSTYSNSIHTGDQLYIYVYSQTPISAVPFNQETHLVAVEQSRLNRVGNTNHATRMSETYRRKEGRQVEGYLVDQDGYIIFPVIGKLKVDGITYDSLQNKLQQLLIDGEYVLDPVVTVSPMNFRVSVVGEVRRPRELHVTGERLTIFEALAMCGDITEYGLRDNVVVMREKNGMVTPIEIDLTKKTMFDSEVYYLQQNDIVYVQPTMKRRRLADPRQTYQESVGPYASLGVSLAHFVWRLYRRFVIDSRGLFH